VVHHRPADFQIYGVLGCDIHGELRTRHRNCQPAARTCFVRPALRISSRGVAIERFPPCRLNRQR
jgi:hypothetical protein